MRFSVKKFVVWGLVLVIVAAAALWLRERSQRCRPDDITVIDDPALLDDLHEDLADLETEGWIRQHRPGLTADGFNLVFYRRRVPMIIDMNSRVVHSWPQVRGVGRIRLNSDGSLAVIGNDNLIKEYDWDGRLNWSYRLPDKDSFPHHDLIRMRNGNYLILARDRPSRTDILREVDRDGRVVWEWRPKDHAAVFETWDPESFDPIHTNSIRELPPNKWFAAGDERFRPGNILMSARNLETIFIVDKGTGKVVWQYSKDLDRQHEAIMLASGRPGEGHILFFNNGRMSRHAYRRSRVQLLDPVTKEIVWEYSSKNFFSSIEGTAQPLNNNNILITSSQGGRVFEISPGGKIVWEWTPPFPPMRAERLSSDHCPQLAAMPPIKKTRVLELEGDRWLDDDLYQYGLPEDMKRRTISGKPRKVLPENRGCRKLQIPQDATMRVEFGIDRKLKDSQWLEGEFRLKIRAQGKATNLVKATLGSESDSWTRLKTVPLDKFAGQTVNLCLSTFVIDGDKGAASRLVWGNPVIDLRWRAEERIRRGRRITERERKLQEMQLEALGYAD